jgi:hypothetical protein
MSDAHDTALQQAISTVAQSDPLIKLLQQVRLGRMQSSDAGLRAVTESWLRTYQTVIEGTPLTRQALLRLDPRPRMAVLVDAGVLEAENAACRSLQTSYEKKLAHAPPN